MIVMREQLNVTERAGMKRMKAVRGAVRRGLLAAAALAGMVILTLAAGSGTKPGNSIDLVLREAVEQKKAPGWWRWRRGETKSFTKGRSGSAPARKMFR